MQQIQYAEYSQHFLATNQFHSKPAGKYLVGFQTAYQQWLPIRPTPHVCNLVRAQ
jgi:hypothetical protein